MVLVPALQVPIAWTGDTSNMPTLVGLSTDSILSSGSLLLLDPTDTANPWAAGTPANGAALPNLAWDRASDLVGGGDNAALAISFVNSLTLTGGSPEARFERSVKGGLHGLVSQVNSGSSSNYAAIVPPAAIIAYLYANPGHAYFFSIWAQVDRETTASQDPIYLLYNAGAPPTSNYLAYAVAQNAANAAPAPGNASPHGIGSRNSGGFRAAVPSILNQGFTGWTGTGATSAANLAMLPAIWGNYGAFASLTRNKAKSFTLNRLYLEDLTVSGRSYATVDALDNGLFGAAFSSGGKFYGDSTPTLPSAFA